jgi:hypothetical protein
MRADLFMLPSFLVRDRPLSLDTVSTRAKPDVATVKSNRTLRFLFAQETNSGPDGRTVEKAGHRVAVLVTILTLCGCRPAAPPPAPLPPPLEPPRVEAPATTPFEATAYTRR